MIVEDPSALHRNCLDDHRSDRLIHSRRRAGQRSGGPSVVAATRIP